MTSLYSEVKKRQIDTQHFEEQYFSAIQTLALLADTQNMFLELGRGSGKTTHILGPRIDRVQHSMPGSVQVFLASSYKAIFENLVPGIMEFFTEHYEEDMYFSIGKRPPAHFKACRTLITDWKNTISFCNGTVIQFVSCERPERANGKNIAHLYMDEMLHIKERVVNENVIPALRSKSTVYYDSPWFMGITGTTSTPNIETDEDWFLRYQQKCDPEKIGVIQQLALELDKRYYLLEKARTEGNADSVRKLEQYTHRVSGILNALRRDTTCYFRASSFSNIKVLGLEYIQRQIDSTLDTAMLNTSIFAVRENRVKDMFFCKFGPMYINSDSYRLEQIEQLSLNEQKEFTCADMQHCRLDAPLYAGYDPGGFSSLVVGQYSEDQRTFYVLKNFYAIWPEQQEELLDRFVRFFGPMTCRSIYLHYDRAANQHDPQWKKFRPYLGDTGDTDAALMRDILQRRGWYCTLMSLGMPVITYRQHLHLLTRLFSGEKDYEVHGQRVILLQVDENECEALISSIYNSPLKRHQGDVQLDKSSEKLPYEQQAYQSTQIASAFMYLLWGEFSNSYLPTSDTHQFGRFAGLTFGA